jgi:hypothetical protein
MSLKILSYTFTALISLLTLTSALHASHETVVVDGDEVEEVTQRLRAYSLTRPRSSSSQRLRTAHDVIRIEKNEQAQLGRPIGFPTPDLIFRATLKVTHQHLAPALQDFFNTTSLLREEDAQKPWNVELTFLIARYVVPGHVVLTSYTPSGSPTSSPTFSTRRLTDRTLSARALIKVDRSNTEERGLPQPTGEDTLLP